MTVYCHRCAGSLDEEATFCPHCAAPQLRITLPDEADEAAATRGPERRSGGQPGLRTGPLTRDLHAIDWRTAFRTALLIAIPVGILTVPPLFFPLIIAGPILGIMLYHRRSPETLLNGRSGFRIGALMGTLAAYVSALCMACWRIIERFPLHQGAALDRDYVTAMQQSTAMAQGMASSTQASLEQSRAWLNFVLTPGGRAGMTLFSMLVTAAGTVLLAGFGGMLGARLAVRRAAQQQH